MPDLALVSIACALICAGMFLLTTNWKKNRSLASFKVIGWALISLATPFWISAYGSEFGISFQLIAIALIAWSFITINLDIKPVRELAVKRNTSNSNLNKSSNKQLIAAQVIAIVFITPIASLCLSQVVTALLPISLAGQLVVQALGFPVIWSLLAIWLCYSHKFWQLSSLQLALSIIYLWQAFG